MKQSCLAVFCFVLPGIRNVLIGQVVTHESCVESTQRILGQFQGEYDVRAAFRAGPARWDSSSAYSRFASDLGGCLVREDFSGTRFEEPYQYIAFWGANASPPERVQRTFVHSQHGLLGLSVGGWNTAADSLVVEDSAFVRGQWIRERSAFSRPRNGAFVSDNWRSEDHGRTWFLTQHAQYVRHGSQPAIQQPESCPRPALRQLAALVGEWDVSWDTRVNDTLVAMDDAHAIITPAAAQCAIVERLDGRLRGLPTGLTEIISSPGPDDLELGYVDSQHGSVLTFEGSVRGDTIQFASRRDLGTRSLMVRREFLRINAQRFETRTIMSPDSGRNWILVQRARYERAR